MTNQTITTEDIVRILDRALRSINEKNEYEINVPKATWILDEFIQAKLQALKAENERLTQALADSVAGVKLLRDGINESSGVLDWHGIDLPVPIANALAQTDKEAYR